MPINKPECHPLYNGILAAVLKEIILNGATKQFSLIPCKSGYFTLETAGIVNTAIKYQNLSWQVTRQAIVVYLFPKVAVT